MNRQSDSGRVTLQDIARETGYTINTVSRALKNKHDISRATCEKIQRVAKDMGYVRNYVASSLRSGHTKTIAVILAGMSNPYYGIMADEIQKEATSLGYSLIFLCSRDSLELEYQMAETAVGRRVDGVLLFPGRDSSKTEALLRASSIPYVLMSRYHDVNASDTAVCDEFNGAYLAAKHLLDQGHKKIGMLSHVYVPFASDNRTAGFLKACKDAGFEEAEHYVAIENNNEAIVQRILEWKREGITGIFSFCDFEAWNTITLLAEHGIHVPEDMAFIGFDNIQEILKLPSPLCSVGFDIHKMTADAIRLLRRRIHHEKLETQSYVYSVQLVCRGSCGCKMKNISTEHNLN